MPLVSRPEKPTDDDDDLVVAAASPSTKETRSVNFNTHSRGKVSIPFCRAQMECIVFFVGFFFVFPGRAATINSWANENRAAERLV